MPSDKEASEQQQTKCGTPHQRRSSPARRRRTDFSQFIQSSSSNSSPSSDAVVTHCRGLMKSAVDAESPSSGIITAFDETKSRTEDVQKHLLSSSDSSNRKQLFISDKALYSPDKQDSPDSINVRNESTIRKSARARKLSVCLDMEIIPSKSTKQARRIKILRHLGLAPPAGSPFARPTTLSTDQ